VGESIPSIDLYEGDPGNSINMADLCKNKKVVVFGVPGAFTPSCSRNHLPGYLHRQAELRKKGVDEIICISVNDTFVMEAWGKLYEADGKIRMFADPEGTYTKTIGLDFLVPKLGGIRSKRYSMVVDKGIVTHISVEPDGVGLSCSLASKLPI
ncbi:peroxiredoxin-5, putative, partial [Pediculus humanus corporis]